MPLIHLCDHAASRAACQQRARLAPTAPPRRRRRFCAAVRATAAAMGERWTACVLEPLFVAAAAVPPRDCAPAPSPHVAKLAAALTPQAGPRRGRPRPPPPGSHTPWPCLRLAAHINRVL